MTSSEVLAWLKLPASNTEAVELALRNARAIIEKEVDWYFGPPRPTVEILSGNGSNGLYLRQPPVEGYPLTVQDRRNGFRAPWAEIEVESYEASGRRLIHESSWLRGYRTYRVTYYEGFEEVPGDVQALMLEMVAGALQARGKEGMKSETIGDYSYTKADMSSSPTWKTVINNWKRGRI